MLDLSTPVTSLRMVGPVYGNRLMNLGIITIKDLLYHLPHRYDDFSIITKLYTLQTGETVTVRVKVISFKNIYTKTDKKLQKALVADETGEIEVIWYNQPFLEKIIKPGREIVLSGKVDYFGSKLVFQSPKYEIFKPTTNLIHTGRLVPVYPETEGVSSKWLRSRIYSILTKFSPEIEETLPCDLINQYHLVGNNDAIFQVHFPKSIEEAQLARQRLEFDELLTLRINSLLMKKSAEKENVGKVLKVRKFIHKILNFVKSLPYKLTESQKKASKEILVDLGRSKPMNRLLEGDVGSGKTVVATIAMYLVHVNKRKSILMAPTDILAKQHFQTVNGLLTPFDIKVGLITGDTKIDPKSCDVLIGTHALIAKKLKFSKIGLIVIDEQQRFGVEQRGILRKKAKNPHLLSMTATPIPRTIALTLYANLDLSVLTDMPLGRLPVKTWVVPVSKRQAAYEWIRKKIKEVNIKNQTLIICPLIEPSETLISVKAVKVEFERLKKEVFPDLRLDLLHGRLKNNQKAKILKRFKNGKSDILVSTPVIEVGIDIPTATIIIIEGAERFGLAQLHQLRGRVGRGDQQSYCLLFTDSDSQLVLKRLKYLETTFNGPKLAELDLKLRGAGDLYGIRQHGLVTSLKIASFNNPELITKTKEAADKILSTDPSLSSYPYLRKNLQNYTISNIASD